MKKKILTTCLIFASLTITTDVSAKFYNGNAKECPILYKMEPWYQEKTIYGEGYWVRGQRWIDGSWETSTGVGIAFDQSRKSYSIKSNPKSSAVMVYIGPWQKTTLVKGWFWNKETTEVEIRMIATQNKGAVRRHYEIKDKLNENIPEEPFVLIDQVSATPITDLCDIEWVSKYGYDAIADCHLNPLRHFGGSTLKCSGKIINAYTKEIIADEKGNLLKPTKESKVRE
jgi:hypothetical protein